MKPKMDKLKLIEMQKPHLLSFFSTHVNKWRMNTLKIGRRSSLKEMEKEKGRE